MSALPGEAASLVLAFGYQLLVVMNAHVVRQYLSEMRQMLRFWDRQIIGHTS